MLGWRRGFGAFEAVGSVALEEAEKSGV